MGLPLDPQLLEKRQMTRDPQMRFGAIAHSLDPPLHRWETLGPYTVLVLSSLCLVVRGRTIGMGLWGTLSQISHDHKRMLCNCLALYYAGCCMKRSG